VLKVNKNKKTLEASKDIFQKEEEGVAIFPISSVRV